MQSSPVSSPYVTTAAITTAADVLRMSDVKVARAILKSEDWGSSPAGSAKYVRQYRHNTSIRRTSNGYEAPSGIKPCTSDVWNDTGELIR